MQSSEPNNNTGYRNPSIESDERLKTQKHNLYQDTTTDLEDSYQQFQRQQQPLRLSHEQQYESRPAEMADHHRQKSNITDIIENFQREKQAFNSKLQNLKAKLSEMDLNADEK